MLRAAFHAVPWKSPLPCQLLELQLQQQQRCMSYVRQKRRTPSRMVLSDRVDRPAAAVREAAGERRPRRRVEGPFSGMNRTVANIREAPVSWRSKPEEEKPRSRHSSSNNSNRDRDRGGARPFKALRMQQSLATVGYGQRTHVKTRMQETESFEQMPLLPEIQAAIKSEALRGLVDIKPTPIQRLAIPALLGQTPWGRGQKKGRAWAADGDKQEEARNDFLLAAETGSGKTLAYLLPAIDAIKRAEATDADIIAYKQRLEVEKQRRAQPGYNNKRGPRDVFEPHPTTGRPRVIVLVPSAELVDQVGAVAKALSHAVKFKTELLSAHLAPRIMERNLHSPTGIDVVVSTPHLLASVAEADPNVLSRVTHLIVDEADSLLDRSFAPETMAILERARPSLRQLVLCSATIPRRLDNYLAAHFPNMQRITTPNLHAIPRRVQLGVIDVTKDPYRNNKNLACADAIWSIGKGAAPAVPAFEAGAGTETDTNAANSAVKHIMVFVNERDKAQEVADFLRSKGIDAVALHRDASEQRSSFAAMLAEFTLAGGAAGLEKKSGRHNDPRRAAPPPPPRGPGGRTLPNTKVIVATDLASRGIDTVAVRHVVLYDVPHTTIDFIHRLGRAGRMGRRGRGVVLVGKDDRRDVVAEVRESMYMGQALV